MNVLDKIMNGSLEVFVDRGFDRSSISLITKSSGVSNGAIYHHFKTKDDIIKGLYIKLKLEFIEYILNNLKDNQNLKEKVYFMWSSIIKWSMDNPKKKKFINMFISSPYHQDLDKSQFNEGMCMFEGLLHDGITLDYIAPIDIDLFYCITMGSTDAYINYLLANPGKNNNEFLEKSFITYWRSIASF